MRFVLVLALTALTARAGADASVATASPLPAACLAELERVRRAFGFHAPEISTEDGVWSIAWTRGAIDCDGDSVRVWIRATCSPATRWRETVRESTRSYWRRTGERAVGIDADPISCEDIAPVMRRMRAALDRCLN